MDLQSLLKSKNRDKELNEGIQLDWEYPVILFCIFLSGISALIYEVLWLKELRLLFGSSSYSAATTFAAFFLGMSIGGFFWGKKVSNVKNPLFLYSLLEIGIAVTASFYFFILIFYYYIYSPLYGAISDIRFLFIIIKFILGLGILFFPAFFMGGTFPVIGQYLIRQPKQLGKIGSLIYTVNISGAIIGALIAGFYLPIILGFTKSYILAIFINFTISIIAFILSKSAKKDLTIQKEEKREITQKHKKYSESKSKNNNFVWLVAFMSGFLTIGLEILWIRMFAQIFENSVYTFSSILVILLCSFTIGSIIANFLCRTKLNPNIILYIFIILSGICVGLSPFIYIWKTSLLSHSLIPKEWAGYIFSILSKVSIVIFIPAIFMGCIFPYLLKIAEKKFTYPGTTIGKLISINTIGAILGSICAGFLFINIFGLYISIWIMVLFYLILSFFIYFKKKKIRIISYSISFTGILIFIIILSFVRLPKVSLRKDYNEKIVEIFEGSHSTVSVTKTDYSLRMKVNNSYLIGSSYFAKEEELLSHIPILLHNNPKKIFYLGMGTGITAAGALYHPVNEITVTELLPEVVKAAKKYYKPYVHGLFDNKKVNLIIEDGRNYLHGIKNKYDLIIGDLFYPEEAGSLYSKEHFEVVYSRLNKNGIFAQWVPLYQLTKNEFFIIVKTLFEVFPHVTLWRGDFYAQNPAIALICFKDEINLNKESIIHNLQNVVKPLNVTKDMHKVLPYIFYAGNLSANKTLFKEYPVNSDDFPIIEYIVSKSSRPKNINKSPWFTSIELINFYNQLFNILPPEKDPFLEKITDKEINYILGGFSFYKYKIYKDAGNMELAKQYYNDYNYRINK